MKSRRVIFGILLVLAGVLIAISAFDVIPPIAGISSWRIFAGAVLLGIVIDGFIKLNFFKAFLCLGFEIIVFEELLGRLMGRSDENWIHNATVLLMASLIGFGLNLIFRNSRRSVRVKRKHHWRISKESFNDHLEYVDCTKFKTVNIRNHFGDYDVRFENVESYNGDGIINVENSFGCVTIYVPSHWEVKCEIANSMGDVTVEPELTQRYADGSARILTLRGTNKFGDVNINAV